MTARPIRRNAQTPDRNGKIFYTSTTSLSHISKYFGLETLFRHLITEYGSTYLEDGTNLDLRRTQQGISVCDPYYFGSFAAMELIMIGDVCALVGSSAWSANRADPGPCDTMIDVTEYLKTPGLPIDYLMDKIVMTC